MTDPHLEAAFDQAISGRRLLEHPYYQQWQDGSLSNEDLGAYAEQYRHVERCLPRVLAAIADRLGEGAAGRLVRATLRDEQTQPRPHVQLFEGFAVAVGATEQAAATKTTRELVALYDGAASSDPVAALSVIGAYELQAAEVAATKGESLRRHYRLGADGTEFWDVHAELEHAHGAWTVEALRALGAAPSTVFEFAVMSSSAWWAFLDERNAARSTAEAS
jgi:pyrroloquinoline quinone (PQQ) biosynthesis protein C